jgi:hypothetical protein
MEKARESTVCPYCLSPIEDKEERVLCPACGVAHHVECWQTNGKCSVYGCDGWQAWDADIAEKIAPKLKGDLELDGTDLEVAPRTRGGPLCIECGKPVKRGQLTCRKCRTRNSAAYQGCMGTSILLIGGVITIVTLLVKGLS